MPYGYLGQNTPNQTVSNSGVFSISDVASLEKQGKFGGSLELIAEENPSGVSAVIFNAIQENVYDVHLLQVNNFIPTNATELLRIQFYESGVLETANYQMAYQIGDSSGGFSEFRTTNDNHIRATVQSHSSNGSNSYNYLYNLGNSSKYSFQTMQSTGIINASTYNFYFGGGVLPQASTVDGLKVFTNSGAYSANLKLYGVKQI
jgi:hypothetical protein